MKIALRFRLFWAALALSSAGCEPELPTRDSGTSSPDGGPTDDAGLDQDASPDAVVDSGAAEDARADDVDGAATDAQTDDIDGAAEDAQADDVDGAAADAQTDDVDGAADAMSDEVDAGLDAAASDADGGAVDAGSLSGDAASDGSVLDGGMDGSVPDPQTDAQTQVDSGAQTQVDAQTDAQLGDAETSEDIAFLDIASSKAAFTSPDSGGAVCARRPGGVVTCWGGNVYGEFGNGIIGEAHLPTAIANLAGAEEISIGGTFACARRGDGTVWCSGRNDVGQLGNGTTNSLIPVQVSGLSGVVQLATGARHACARLESGDVRCWGAHNRGQLGIGPDRLNPSPPFSAVPVVVPLENAVEIVAGQDHTCAIAADSSIRCWGAGFVGQLGSASPFDSAVLQTVFTTNEFSQVVITNPVRMALGQDHSCALLAAGTVACWGSDGLFQMAGQGFRGIPILIPGITDAVEIEAAGFYTCVRRAGGTISCWGTWPGGGVAAPTAIAGVSDAVALAVGVHQSCAIKDDGSALCWGGNRWGQMGNGTRSDVPVSAAVPVSSQ